MDRICAPSHLVGWDRGEGLGASHMRMLTPGWQRPGVKFRDRMCAHLYAVVKSGSVVAPCNSSVKAHAL